MEPRGGLPAPGDLLKDGRYRIDRKAGGAWRQALAAATPRRRVMHQRCFVRRFRRCPAALALGAKQGRRLWTASAGRTPGVPGRRLCLAAGLAAVRKPSFGAVWACKGRTGGRSERGATQGSSWIAMDGHMRLPAPRTESPMLIGLSGLNLGRGGAWRSPLRWV